MPVKNGSNTAFEKQKGKGRPKGTVNKTTAALKDMILQALTNKGGVKYLERQADENPVSFLTLVGKVLPLQVAGDPDGAPIVVVTGVPRAKG